MKSERDIQSIRCIYYSLSTKERKVMLESLISQLRPDQKIAVQKRLFAIGGKS